MSLLPYDLTRCLGEGSAGRKCPQRDDCRRYTERHAPAGVAMSYAAMLCRARDYECRIPVKGEAE